MQYASAEQHDDYTARIRGHYERRESVFIGQKGIAPKLGLMLAIGAASTEAYAGDGLYIGANAGYNMVKKQDLSIDFANDTALQPDGDFATVKLDDGWLYGANLGYAFASGLRTELSFDRRLNDLKRVDTPPSGLLGGRGGRADNVDGREVGDTMLLNVWFDLFKQSRIHPYVGGGAGFARISLRDVGFDDVTTFDKHDAVFAYQAGAGVGVDITDHFTVGIDYRYLWTQDAKFNPLADDSNPSKIKLNYESSSAVVSLRYSFGGKAEPEQAEEPQQEEEVAVVEPVESAAPVEEAQAEAAPVSTAECIAPQAGERISLEGCKAGDTFVLRGVTFEFNKSTLTPDAKSILDEVADELNARPDIKVELNGHTDDEGSDSYNQQLSQGRAESVKAYLVERGVDVGRMSSQGFGETQPVADNNTEEGQFLNRRVELKVVDSGSGAAATPAEPATAVGSDESVPADAAATEPSADTAAPADPADESVPADTLNADGTPLQ